jgi:hypothetical protein
MTATWNETTETAGWPLWLTKLSGSEYALALYASDISTSFSPHNDLRHHQMWQYIVEGVERIGLQALRQDAEYLREYNLMCMKRADWERGSTSLDLWYLWRFPEPERLRRMSDLGALAALNCAEVAR